MLILQCKAVHISPLLKTLQCLPMSLRITKYFTKACSRPMTFPNGPLWPHPCHLPSFVLHCLSSNHNTLFDFLPVSGRLYFLLLLSVIICPSIGPEAYTILGSVCKKNMTLCIQNSVESLRRGPYKWGDWILTSLSS